jgi:hypothetical protein
MKRYIFCFSLLAVLFCAGCQKEEILTDKPGEAVAPVTDLKHTVAGNQAELTWKLPATLPKDIVKPVSVLVRILVDGQNGGTQVLNNNPERFTYPGYDAARKYRFTVKVQAGVDTQDPARSKLRLSPGTTITF